VFLISLSITVLLPSIAFAQSVADSEYSMTAPLAAKSLLLDIAAVDDSFVAVGERGHVLISDALARNWSQVRVPTRATLTAVSFHDHRLGLAVGHDAVILRTDDGGRTWRRVHYAPEEERPLLDVWFQNGGRAIAVGAYGYYLESHDGGLTWHPRIIKSRVEGDDHSTVTEPQDEEIGDDFHLNQIKVSGTGRFYMAAEAGTVYRSDDEGKTWLRLPSPYEGTFFGVLTLNDDSLLLFGLQGRLFRSTDAGVNWKRIDTGTRAALGDGIRLRDDTIVIVGFSGTVLISHDDGQSFTLRQQSNRSAIATLRELNDGDLLLVGEGGTRHLPADRYRSKPR
jgi:photosystem II stability/assembly factor-like uncharacterized protein